jgi:hypothetical protein
MWVLILLYLSSANAASVAMHDFESKAACEHAREVATYMESPGERIRPVCVPKQ